MPENELPSYITLTSVICGLFHADTFTEVVCARGGNSWCKVGCNTL